MKSLGIIFGLFAALSFSFAEVTLHCGGCEGEADHSEADHSEASEKECDKCEGCDKDKAAEPTTEEPAAEA